MSPLDSEPWTDAAAEAAVAGIVATTLAECQTGEGWRAHPLDDPGTPGEHHWPLYHGAGGVVLGAGHGFVGNPFPFLRAAPCLPEAQRDRMLARGLQTLQASALRADGAANWHPMPTPAWDTLLAEAGAAVWAAGPLTKGVSLCCGIGGSALARLKPWRRNGPDPWLDRARALALHAAGQVARHRAQYGQGRHSPWTGDLGAACILQACRDGDDRF